MPDLILAPTLVGGPTVFVEFGGIERVFDGAEDLVAVGLQWAVSLSRPRLQSWLAAGTSAAMRGLK